jgi:hypothetical protein
MEGPTVLGIGLQLAAVDSTPTSRRVMHILSSLHLDQQASAVGMQYDEINLARSGSRGIKVKPQVVEHVPRRLR